MAGFFTGLGEDLPSTLQHLKFSMQYSPLHELRRRAEMSTPETGREERKKEKEQEKKTSCCATSRAERTPPCRTSAIQAGPVAPTCSDRSCAQRQARDGQGQKAKGKKQKKKECQPFVRARRLAALSVLDAVDPVAPVRRFSVQQKANKHPVQDRPEGKEKEYKRVLVEAGHQVPCRALAPPLPVKAVPPVRVLALGGRRFGLRVESVVRKRRTQRDSARRRQKNKQDEGSAMQTVK